ncbi:MAG: ABC transporter substrate-binding protein [Acidimicrobiia bacterium]
MRKRYSWLLLVFVMALVAASCSDSSDDTTTTAGGTEDTTTTTAAPSGGDDTTTTTAAPVAEMVTGRGVDADAKVITLGLLADLTGLFAGLVIDITDAQKVYWDLLNAAGGIDGWTVELVIEDTNYNVEQHIEKYEKIRGDVVAISQSTGSPTNVAALDLYKEDSMLVIPLSWYSGWAIPDFDGGVMLEQNTNYCLEAMNILDFVNEMGGKTIALATFPGDYGQDASAGVKLAIEHYGMELVYDGEAAVIPGQDQTPVIQSIVASGADWTFMTTNPSIGAEILAGAVLSGHEGAFTGSVPTYNFALLDSPAGPLYDLVYYQSGYNVGWGESTPGNDEMMAAMSDEYPDRRPSDSFIVGWNEAITMRKVLATAIANLDLSPEGVVAAANSVTEVDFGGAAPNQAYSGTPNDYVQRSLAMFKPDIDLYTAAGGPAQTLSQADGTTGSVLVKDFFVGSLAEEFDFSAACYEL